jgi:hypothetical protein
LPLTPKQAPAGAVVKNGTIPVTKEFSNSIKDENIRSFADKSLPTEGITSERRESKGSVSKSSSRASPSVARSSPPAAPAATSAAVSTLPADASFQKRRGEVVQSFSQTSSPLKAKVNSADRAANVLVSFQVEQNGQELRIIDRDGSVYTGSWQPSESPSSRIGSPKYETTDTLASKPQRKLTETAGATAPRSNSPASLPVYGFRDQSDAQTKGSSLAATSNLYSRLDRHLRFKRPKASAQSLAVPTAMASCRLSIRRFRGK